MLPCFCGKHFGICYVRLNTVDDRKYKANCTNIKTWMNTFDDWQTNLLKWIIEMEFKT